MSGEDDDPSTETGVPGAEVEAGGEPEVDAGAGIDTGAGIDAEAFERGRPGYPREAAVWLTSDHSCAVLELGAGTGKLTRELVALGHEVDATDPDPAMLQVLRREAPDVETANSSAEEIPAPDRSYDVVLAAGSAHLFDLERALPEIARVLRPGGRLSLVWNEPDERIPWVRRLGALLSAPAPDPDPARDRTRDPGEQRRDCLPVLEDSELFGPVEVASHRFWHGLQRQSVQDLLLSQPWVVGLGDAERAARLADVLAFYDDYGRGMDGMQMPLRAETLRTTVRRQVRLQASEEAGPDTTAGLAAGLAAGPARPGAGDQHGAEGREVDDTMPRGLRARHRAGAGASTQRPTDGPGDPRDGSTREEGREEDGDEAVLLIDFD